MVEYPRDGENSSEDNIIDSVFDDVTIDFGAKFTASVVFDKIFQEGMSLIEETAAYLDGPGRVDAKVLVRPVSLSYATESMRLTTRLMQLASWLLLQRAVKNGEMKPKEVLKEQYRIKLEEIGASENNENAPHLPEGLKDLIARSLSLHERILRLDHMMRTDTALRVTEPNFVNDQVTRLAEAFAQSYPDNQD